MTPNLLDGNVNERSRNCLMQPRYGFSPNDGQESCVNIKLSWGPNARKINAAVSAEIGPNTRPEQVRAKLTDQERRNLRVTVFWTSWDIWR